MTQQQDYINKSQDDRIKCLEGHIEILNKEMGDVKTAVEKTATDMAWLKQFFWVIATASVGSLVAALCNLIIK